MKVLVLGSKGMAGHMVVKYLTTRGYDITTAARSGADLTLSIDNEGSVASFLNGLTEQYDYVINCIGMLVKPCIDDPVAAITVNSLFPHQLEKHFKNTPTRVVHLSTDCIFDGATGNYTEKDTPTETNMYGRSKLLGELNNDKDITFRMSIIGPEIKDGTGLLHWVTSNKDDTLPGWSNAWWNGITTLQLAKCIDQYMQDPKISGLYHLTGTTEQQSDYRINKFELLKMINEVYRLNKKIVDTTGPKSINKVLINTRSDEFNFNIPSYKLMITELEEFYKEQ